MGVAIVVAIVVALLVLALVALAIATRFAGRPASRDVDDDRPDVLDAAPVRLPDAVPAMPHVIADAEEPAIAWTAQLTAATLDEAARLRLIDDLVLLRAAWSVALLRRAHEEEPAPHVRARIGEALAACGEPIETTA
jgi:hypothetical protein